MTKKRFAFYGRVSTEDAQDPTTSRAWQLDRARPLIELADGELLAEFFDVGQSRSLPWKRRPEATALLEEVSRRKRSFDAVVIGEPHRAFSGSQFADTFPLLSHYGVELWVPEIGGRVDPDSEAHDLVMNLFGGMSKGERQRMRTRVRSGMRAQAQAGTRAWLGGRPPFGYRLADAGPHPVAAKASLGQRLHCLEPHPDWAPVVKRIYQDFLSGIGYARIAAKLTEESVPCPSAADIERNPHRAGLAWSKSAVRAILTNPNYTGHLVWNRTAGQEVLIDPEDVQLGTKTQMSATSPEEWLWSPEPQHTALIPRADWEKAQDVLATRKRSSPRRRRAKDPSVVYQLSGLINCDVCRRRMQGQQSHGRTYYRCRHDSDYAPSPRHPRNVYVREDVLVPELDRWLAQLFDPNNLTQTQAALRTAAELEGQTSALDEQVAAALEGIEDELEKYRQLLRLGTDLETVSGWIKDATARRRRLLDSNRPPGPPPDSRLERVMRAIDRAHGITNALQLVDPTRKAQLYEELRLHLTFDPITQRVTSTVDLGRGVSRVGGGT